MAKLFSKVAGAGVFKTRYGMIAFIVVDFRRELQLFVCQKRKVLSFKQAILPFMFLIGAANLFC